MHAALTGIDTAMGPRTVLLYAPGKNAAPEGAASLTGRKNAPQQLRRNIAPFNWKSVKIRFHTRALML